MTIPTGDSRGRTGILAGGAVALGCSVPLVLLRPLPGALGIGVIVGYATAAYWSVPSDRRLARWLLVGLLLWGGSLTRGGELGSDSGPGLLGRVLGHAGRRAGSAQGFGRPVAAMR